MEVDTRARSLALFKRLHPGAVVFRHEDLFRAGVPDTSISWKGVVSWWEFKHQTLTGRIPWRGAQGAEMRRLWATGVPAYYPIFRETKSDLMLLVQPATASYKSLDTPTVFRCNVYNNLIQFIEQIHQEV
jgi:hypothetical protein